MRDAAFTEPLPARATDAPAQQEEPEVQEEQQQNEADAYRIASAWQPR
jgi:hypothetical protein